MPLAQTNAQAGNSFTLRPIYRNGYSKNCWDDCVDVIAMLTMY